MITPRYTPIPEGIKIDGDDWEMIREEPSKDVRTTSMTQPSPSEVKNNLKTEEQQLAARMLESDLVGSQAWMNDNRYIGVGRRPMKEWPDIWLRESELVEILGKLQASQIPPSKYKDLFKKCVSRIDQWKASNKPVRDINCFAWMTTYIWKELVDEVINELRLKRQLER